MDDPEITGPQRVCMRDKREELSRLHIEALRFVEPQTPQVVLFDRANRRLDALLAGVDLELRQFRAEHD